MIGFIDFTLPGMTNRPSLPNAHRMLGRFLYFIVNPHAGVGTGRYALSKVEEIVRRGEGEVAVLQHGEDVAIAVEQALYQGATDIIAVGGDGTVGGVAGTLAGTDVHMGIVPAGTANMFARELGIPISISGSLDLIMGERGIRQVDAMEVNGRRFIHQVLLGVGSEALSRVTSREKRILRRSVYALMGLRAFRDFRPVWVNAIIDGEEVSGWVSQVLIANAGILGIHPFRLGPDIRVDDGRADVIFMGGRSRTSLILAGLYLLGGSYDEAHRMRCFPVRRSAHIETEPKTIIRADGEFIGMTPLDLTVLPGAVKAIVPSTV